MPNQFLQAPYLERLRRDRAEMEQLREESSILSFETQGDPAAPTGYLVIFRGKGLEDASGVATIRDVHQVEVSLNIDYPKTPPRMVWRTPLLHPNVNADGRTCLDLFTMGPGVRLVDMVELLWDLARMAVFNVAQADIEAWNGVRRTFGFPVDERTIRDRLLRKDAGASMGAADGSAGLEWKVKAIEQYLKAHDLSHDSHVYTREKWRERNEKYGNEAELTITTEGPLYALLNRGDWETAAEELDDFNRFLDSLGLWYELGYAWTVHLYPTERP